MKNLIITKGLKDSSAFNVINEHDITITIEKNIDVTSIERSNSYFDIMIVTYSGSAPKMYLVDKLKYNSLQKEFTLYNSRNNTVVSSFLLHGTVATLYLFNNGILVTFNEEE